MAFGSIQMAKRCDRPCRGQRWSACATVCRRLPPIARIEFSLCYFILLLPAVNAELMFQAATNANGDFNQVIYWSRLLNWKNQTLTPNPDTIYLFPIYNTKDVGPMVLEIPPADQGASITGCVHSTRKEI